MSLHIRDGLGSGRTAGVNAFNRLEVGSIMKPESAYQSLRGRLFVITSAIMAVPGDATFRPVLWVKNLSSTESFYFERATYIWNGGNTTGTKPLQVQSLLGMDEPTTNLATFGPFSLNASVAYTPPMKVHTWNGVGAGMTGGASAGFATTAAFVTGYEGILITPSSGEIVLGPGAITALQLNSPEAGIAQLSITGWFAESTERF